MCIAHRLLLSTSEISDATASMPSPGYFALQHRVAPPRKAYSLTSSAFIAFGALYPFSLFKPVFRGSLNKDSPPPCGRGKSLFSMIQVEVAILMELLALFDTLSVLAVGRVKLVMQMDILFGFSAADKICIFLQHMILVVTHVSDQQDQTQP